MKRLEDLALHLRKFYPFTVTACESVYGSLKFFTFNCRRDASGEDYHVSLGRSVCEGLQSFISIVLGRNGLQSHLSCKLSHVHSCTRSFRNGNETLHKVAATLVCDLCIRICGPDSVKNCDYMCRVSVVVAEHHRAVGCVRTENGDLPDLLRLERKDIVVLEENHGLACNVESLLSMRFACHNRIRQVCPWSIVLAVEDSEIDPSLDDSSH